MPEVNVQVPAAGGDAGTSPQSRVTRRQEPRQPQRALTTDDFVDDALATIGELLPAPSDEETPPAPPKRAKKPPKEEPPPEDDQQLHELEEPPPDDEGEPSEDDEGDSEPAYGTRENPYVVGDLPKDKYIKLKVDGEERTVSFAELARGWVAEKTFYTRLNRTKAIAQQAEEVMEQAQALPRQQMERFQQLLSTPERLYELMRNDFEPTLDKMARMYARDLDRWSKNPHERVAFERQRAETKIANQQRALEAREQAAQRSQQEQQRLAARVARIRPGWDAGLQEAKYPDVTPEFKMHVHALIQAHERSSGREIETDQVRQIVVRVAKLLGAQPAAQRKPAPPIITRGARPQGERQAQGRRGGGKDFGAMSHDRRTSDADWYMDGMRLRG